MSHSESILLLFVDTALWERCAGKNQVCADRNNESGTQVGTAWRWKGNFSGKQLYTQHFYV
jgi:hypothetical protein